MAAQIKTKDGSPSFVMILPFWFLVSLSCYANLYLIMVMVIQIVLL